jgi:1-deoxy-D-xylulose-5-phosphate reductoisomerase
VKSLAVLGSTGSIGRATLSVVDAYPDRFRVVALAAGRNLDALAEQISRHRPSMISVAQSSAADAVAASHPNTTVLSGAEGLRRVACHPDAEMVVAALVGAVGLAPTLAAIRAGKDIALANKETLVVAGSLIMREVAAAGVHLLPIDSEHSAIHQALRVGAHGTVRRLILTASGGPFWRLSSDQMARATVTDALAHPTWDMGPKITIDSATMMNKGLEIIEAHHLFEVPEEQIDVLVHRESLVHSMVEYLDGTVIAQLSIHDMRLPILYALAWPDRLASSLPALNLAAAGTLSFEAPDGDRFPAIETARSALRAGGEMPAVLNAANEEAVRAFLDGQCAFGDIVSTVEAVMEQWGRRNRPLEDIEQAIATDLEARRLANAWIGKYPATQKGSR